MTLADLCGRGQWIVALDACTCSFNLCYYYCDFGKLRINLVILHGTNRQRCWYSSVWQHIYFISKITLHWCVLTVRSLSSVKQFLPWLSGFSDIKKQIFFFPPKHHVPFWCICLRWREAVIATAAHCIQCLIVINW